MTDWQPSASLNILKRRSQLLNRIRQFFAERDVLEVETPLLCPSTVTDPFVVGIPAFFQQDTSAQTLYLQTSPEYAMKRLLAAGSGSIFQICKAFRQGDLGRFHQPEFTMLEWYRVGYDHHALMSEMDELLQYILHCMPAERITYANLFQQFLKINPHDVTESELEKCARDNHLDIISTEMDKDTWLDVLLTHCIEPYIGRERPIFIYDFPASKAALAKIRHENFSVASRFEVYFKGLELANGFHELQDAAEQKKRFEKDLTYRKERNMPSLPIDELFLAALDVGLPDCAGVALGIDRLVLLATQMHSLNDVVSFGFKLSS